MNDKVKRDKQFAIVYQVLRTIIPILFLCLLVDRVINKDVLSSILYGLAAGSYIYGNIKWYKRWANLK